ncbi:MAG: hypothetical protein H6Q75_905 [Firmicutes bacterium]|nr:hypothetical protein [Bacillota bacterium]
MILYNSSKDCLLAKEARVADTFFSRLKGLLGTDKLEETAALMIYPCSSVHTFGMRYVIDVAFVDIDHRVVKLVPHLPPGRMAMCGRSRYVVELAAGTLARTGTSIGDRLDIA